MAAPIISTTLISSVAIVGVTILGIPLGIRVDLLCAGFFGSLSAQVLLPPTRVELVGVINNLVHFCRKVFAALASCVTAAYLAPIIAIMIHMPETVLVAIAFLIGASANSVLTLLITKVLCRIH